ncbi:hypothetical protein HX001_11900 [Empedobacter brevis]|uniref:Uncharacterized protein n=1 Tax=Empedobacter brevis TaxID=247 RepID=A0AAJ1V8N4_9FLAO|nr:hypothetical protein [Empedobacter brevis]MDM1073187.1 hypothetical protein [Empedobacter brevis]
MIFKDEPSLEFKHGGVSASPTLEVRVNKTFELLLNDFKSFVNEKKR